MKLSGPQYRQISEALLDAFPTTGALRSMLLFGLGRSLDEVALGDNLQEVVLNLIGRAAAENWLVDLIRAANEQNPTPLLGRLIIDFAPIIELQNIDHYEVCLMGTSRAMVDRKDLRGSLRRLSTPNRSRALVINGPPVSGKTYSVQLISYLSEVLGFKLVWVDLNRFVGPEIRPRDIAQSIVDQMTLDQSTLPPAGDEQDSRWVQFFCNRLTGQLNNKEDTYWFVLDGFRQKLPEATKDLIQELSRRLFINISNVRLVLIGYLEDLPSDIIGGVEREEINPISEEHLIDFFVQIYEERKKRRNKDYKEEDAAHAVQDSLKDVDMNDPRRLENLSKQIIKVLKGIEEEH